MSTLDLRLARQAANAAAVAEVLAGSPAVRGVRWPWRAEDPSYALAARQMLRPNGVVSAELADEAAVARLLAAAPALDRGDQLRRRAQHDRPAGPVGRRRRGAGFVRLSCGIEDTDDLVADLAAALHALARSAPRGVNDDAQPEVVDEVAQRDRHDGGCGSGNCSSSTT